MYMCRGNNKIGRLEAERKKEPARWSRAIFELTGRALVRENLISDSCEDATEAGKSRAGRIGFHKH